MKMQRKMSLKTIGSLTVLVTVFGLLIGCSSKTKAIEANTNTATGPVQVTTAQAVMQNVPTFVQGTGTFVADEESDVSPKVSGQIISTAVEVGDFVRQGQVIARLDDKDARLRLEQ